LAPPGMHSRLVLGRERAPARERVQGKERAPARERVQETERMRGACTFPEFQGWMGKTIRF
jgi:hypothetical protein